MIKNLKATQHMMCSSFYKSRFVAEFFQVKIRYDKLKTMVEKWDKGELPFTPTCPRELYDQQLSAMKGYLRILVERADLEKVNLAAFDNGMTFSEALAKLYAGEKIALADWGGYWFLGPNQTIMLRTKDGKELDTPDFTKYADREDWRIYDEVNEVNLKEYQKEQMAQYEKRLNEKADTPCRSDRGEDLCKPSDMNENPAPIDANGSPAEPLRAKHD